MTRSIKSFTLNELAGLAPKMKAQPMGRYGGRKFEVLYQGQLVRFSMKSILSRLEGLISPNLSTAETNALRVVADKLERLNYRYRVNVKEHGLFLVILTKIRRLANIGFNKKDHFRNIYRTIIRNTPNGTTTIDEKQYKLFINKVKLKGRDLELRKLIEESLQRLGGWSMDIYEHTLKLRSSSGPDLRYLSFEELTKSAFAVPLEKTSNQNFLNKHGFKSTEEISQRFADFSDGGNWFIMQRVLRQFSTWLQSSNFQVKSTPILVGLERLDDYYKNIAPLFHVANVVLFNAIEKHKKGENTSDFMLFYEDLHKILEDKICDFISSILKNIPLHHQFGRSGNG
jgi:hypothetical protein